MTNGTNLRRALVFSVLLHMVGLTWLSAPVEAIRRPPPTLLVILIAPSYEFAMPPPQPIAPIAPIESAVIAAPPPPLRRAPIAATRAAVPPARPVTVAERSAPVPVASSDIRTVDQYRVALAFNARRIAAPDAATHMTSPRRVVVRIALSTGGEPGAFAVTRSSGSDRIDGTALALAVEAVRTLPVPPLLAIQAFAVELTVLVQGDPATEHDQLER